jgi:hypothetical protein
LVEKISGGAIMKGVLHSPWSMDELLKEREYLIKVPKEIKEQLTDLNYKEQ